MKPAKLNHVMLIDDSDIDNYVNEKVLRNNKIGEIIVTKKSAEEALEYLGELKNSPEEFPDIIFLDIRMPVMDGFGFLERFDLLPENVKKKCKIFMLSSSNDPADVERANKNPYVIKYFTKPLKDDMLSFLKPKNGASHIKNGNNSKDNLSVNGQ
jgi:CheY-like chemotaxis protein